MTAARTTVASLAFLAVATALGLRVAEQHVWPGQSAVQVYALQDFRDAIYYPVRAFLDGDNPYDTPRYRPRYPVGQPFPLYSPLTLLLHLPLGLLSFGLAQTVYFFCTVGLTLLLVWVAFRLCGLAGAAAPVLGVAALVLLGRPGQMNAFIGQSTATVTVAAYAALWLASRRPVAAGFLLAVTTLKPTFGVPLALLMLAHRDWRPVLVAIGAGGIGAAIPAAVLVHGAGGIGPFVASLAESHASFVAEESVNPARSLYRIDLPSVVARLVGHSLGWAEVVLALLVLGGVGLVLWRLAARTDERAQIDAACLACLALLVAVYQQVYSAVLLVLPMVALASSRGGPREGMRWLVLAFLLLPQVNYLVSATAMDRLHIDGAAWVAVTTANGIAVALALTIWSTRARRAPAP